MYFLSLPNPCSPVPSLFTHPSSSPLLPAFSSHPSSPTPTPQLHTTHPTLHLSPPPLTPHPTPHLSPPPLTPHPTPHLSPPPFTSHPHPSPLTPTYTPAPTPHRGPSFRVTRGRCGTSRTESRTSFTSRCTSSCWWLDNRPWTQVAIMCWEAVMADSILQHSNSTLLL